MGAVNHSTRYSLALRSVDRIKIGGPARLIAENHVDGILFAGPHRDDQAVAQFQQHIQMLLMGLLPDKAIPLAEYYDLLLTTIQLPGPRLDWTESEHLNQITQGEGLQDASSSLESKRMTRQANNRQLFKHIERHHPSSHLLARVSKGGGSNHKLILEVVVRG